MTVRVILNSRYEGVLRVGWLVIMSPLDYDQVDFRTDYYLISSVDAKVYITEVQIDQGGGLLRQIGDDNGLSNNNGCMIDSYSVTDGFTIVPFCLKCKDGYFRTDGQCHPELWLWITPVP